MKYCLNVPINSVSFGQVATMILRGLFNKGHEVVVSPIGNSIDFSTQKDDVNFQNWLTSGVATFSEKHNRQDPALKLWHLNGSLESVSKKNILMTFYELDAPTKEEINIAKNCDKLVFTNKETQEIFARCGVESCVVPLAFDDFNFGTKDKKYFDDGRIVFNLTGKFEKRKHHDKIIKIWAKRFGNDRKYSLQCCVYNGFLSEAQNKELFVRAVDGKRYENIQFLNFLQKNTVYNDFLNSANIILAMSGAEGWGLPEFHSAAMGKHAVVLNAHGYKEWANKENAILIQPRGKIDAYDGLFFHPNKPFNQGKIHDFDVDEFISGCEEAVRRVESGKTNEEGLKLQKEFSSDRMTDEILKLF